MLEGRRILAYIPARGGSKGVPGKNLRRVGGLPLVARTVRAALAAASIDYVLVSTDSERIARVAREHGAQVPFLRPAELAGDEARTIDGIVDALPKLEALGERFDAVCLLQPTSPFRDADDIEAALACFAEHGFRGLASVSEARDHPILMRSIDAATGELTRLVEACSTMRRQDMPRWLRIDGAIYANLASEITPLLSLNDNPVGFELPEGHGLEIDSLDDLRRARAAVRRLSARG